MPRAGQVLVGVRATGVDPGVWHFATVLPYIVRPATGLRRPRNRVPDRLEPKPANLTFEAAAAVPTSATAALQALRRGEVAAGQRLLITGAGGGIGTFAVQLAKGLGAHVTGVCGTDKVDLVRSLGADDVVDYTRADVTERYDVVLDIGGSRTLTQLRRMLTPKGTLVIAGGEGGGKWVATFHRSLRAPLVSPFVGQRLRQVTSLYQPEDMQRLAELLAAGELVRW